MTNGGETLVDYWIRGKKLEQGKRKESSAATGL